MRTDAEYASTLAARAARLRAEAAAGSAPAPDEQVKAALARFDAAILGGKRAELDALIVPGELSNFSKGIVGTQPEVWQTRLLRTENVSGSRVAADVSLAVRTLGRDQSGTAVLVFARTPRAQLSDIQSSRSDEKESGVGAGGWSMKLNPEQRQDFSSLSRLHPDSRLF